MEDITLGEIHRNLSDFIKSNEKSHGAILEQVKYTNGKVAGLVAWKERLKGVWLTVGIFAAVLSFAIPIAINAFYSEKSIERIVDKKIGEYIIAE